MTDGWLDGWMDQASERATFLCSELRDTSGAGIDEALQGGCKRDREQASIVQNDYDILQRVCHYINMQL